MEILVPGLILVGFMVWASTRIKRNAARAFEQEIVENSEFALTKPEGFLSLADPEGGLLFSAYSKEFGQDEAERVRRASAQVSRFDGAHFEDICERAKTEASTVISEQKATIAARKCATIIVESPQGDVDVETSYRIIAGDEAVYQLAVTILPEAKEEFSSKTDLLLNTFTLK